MSGILTVILNSFCKLALQRRGHALVSRRSARLALPILHRFQFIGQSFKSRKHVSRCPLSTDVRTITLEQVEIFLNYTTAIKGLEYGYSIVHNFTKYSCLFVVHCA